MTESIPPELATSLDRFVDVLSESELEQIKAVQATPLPTGIRINPLKSEPEVAMQALSARYGWQFKPIPFCKHAWTLQKTDVPPGTTIEHRLGGYYLQDGASMVPVSLYDLHEANPLVLDMAASPGGKTTHLIDRTEDLGFVIANDASRGRIPALRSVLTAWGGINQVVTNFPGEAFGKWFPETFDLILLDAPCSMENLRPTPNHPLRLTTPAERLRLQERQVQLLIGGLRALKIGGQIVYATCSLAPEEDEAVIDHVLTTHPDAFSIEDVTGIIPYRTPGLTAFEDQIYHPSLNRTLRLWPHLTGMSGFFCALLKKVAPIPLSPEAPPNRDFSRTQLEQVSHEHLKRFTEVIALQYGLVVDEVFTKYNLMLFQRHEGLFLIPKTYLERFRNLPFEYIGMQIGQWRGEAFQLSHEFASRFGHLYTRGRVQIDPSQVSLWIAGRDIRNPDTNLSPQGQFLLVTDEDGRNLGVGKLLPNRLRNMLPRSSI